MSDFEAQLARALADSSRPADEEFVARVAHLVGAEERARIIRLILATTVAIFLAGVLCYGLALAWNAANGSGSSRDAMTVAVSCLCLLVFILSLPLAFARE